MPYACRTGTRTTLAALRRHGWRLLLTAGAVLRTEGFRYGLDNGAWGAYQAGEPFDRAAFEDAVRQVGAAADWIVVPDIVLGGLESLTVSRSWLPELAPLGRLLLIPIQDGMTFAHLEPLVEPGRVGIFVGGSTEWKEAAILTWGPWCRRRGIACHVGRVNTARRIALCAAGRVTSFDGSSVARFPSTLRQLDSARRQLALPMGAA
jgi:hypothetical protein